MKHTSLFPLICCLFFSWGLSAQFDDYRPLESQGELPKALTSSSASKYKVLESGVSSNQGKRTRNAQRKYHLESSFGIDQLMRSGQVLFNDPLSEYVNKVADKLLAHDPGLRKKLNFHVVRAPVPNAFATDRGDIFINMGLLAKLETEAQLAFIIAHEIVHVEEKHNMDSYLYTEIEAKAFERGGKAYDMMLKKSNYSKKLEVEADDGGMELFKKSPYGSSSLSGLFDMMALSHIPFEDRPFDKAYLEIGELSIPDSILIDTVATPKAYYESEELSTHPGLKERQESMAGVLGGDAYTAKPDYLVGEEEFKKMSTMARFELCDIYLEAGMFPSAVYHCFLLEKDYPGNRYLEETKVKALYGFAQYNNASDSRGVGMIPWRDVQGEMQRLSALLDGISDREVSAIAALHIKAYFDKYKDDKAMEMRLQDMVEDFMIYHTKEKEDVLKNEVLESKEGKYIAVNKVMYQLLHKPELEQYVKDGQKYRDRFKAREDDYTYARRQYQKRVKDAKKGVSLGLKKVMFVNPVYQKINLKKRKQPIQFVEAEDKQKQMTEMIKRNGQRLKMKVDVLSTSKLSKRGGAEKFNEIVAMERWIGERLSSGIEMIPSNQNRVSAICEKNGTNHIAWTGAIALKRRNVSSGKNFIIDYLLLGSMAGTPIAIYDFATPDYETLFFLAVFDVERNSTGTKMQNYMKQADKPLLIESNLYWFMQQMSRKKKKK